jgi:hypothetical protein
MDLVMTLLADQVPRCVEIKLSGEGIVIPAAIQLVKMPLIVFNQPGSPCQSPCLRCSSSRVFSC